MGINASVYFAIAPVTRPVRISRSTQFLHVVAGVVDVAADRESVYAAVGGHGVAALRRGKLPLTTSISRDSELSSAACLRLLADGILPWPLCVIFVLSSSYGTAE